MGIKMGFAEAMRLDMERREMSEASVGKALGISQQAVGKWLTRGFPPMSRMGELRELLGENSNFAKLTHEDLFGGGQTSRTPNPARTVHQMLSSAGGSAAGLKLVPRETTPVGQYASQQEKDFKENLPTALHHNLDVAMRDEGLVVRADYASETVVAELSYASGVMWNQSWSAALLRLMLFRDKQCPSARAVFILVSDEEAKRFPTMVLLAAKQYHVELMRATSGAQAAAFIADIEGEDAFEPAEDDE